MWEGREGHTGGNSYIPLFGAGPEAAFCSPHNPARKHKGWQLTPLHPGNLAVYFCLWAPCFHRVSPGRLAAAGLEGWSSSSLKGPAATLPSPTCQARPDSGVRVTLGGGGAGGPDIMLNTVRVPTVSHCERSHLMPLGQNSKGGNPHPSTQSPGALPCWASLHQFKSAQRPLACPALFIPDHPCL